MPQTRRALIKKQIITEFVRPPRKSNKVIIILGGLPGLPPRRELQFFLAAQGYWIFVPRYRGTWESSGRLFAQSPHLDVIDVIDALTAGFTDIGSHKKYRLKNPQISLIGSSFGGPAAILASIDKRVKYAVAISPVIDWTVQAKNPTLSLAEHEKFVRQAFGQGYRGTHNGWQKLLTGRFYNPATVVNKLDKNKLYIIAAKDDDVVLIGPTLKFVKELGCRSSFLNKGGHTLRISQAPIWHKIKNFLNH